MGFVFGLVGAIVGIWLISEGRSTFGFLTGMMLGRLLHRLLQAKDTIRQLLDRVNAIEQRNASIGW